MANFIKHLVSSLITLTAVSAAAESPSANVVTVKLGADSAIVITQPAAIASIIEKRVAGSGSETQPGGDNAQESAGDTNAVDPSAQQSGAATHQGAATKVAGFRVQVFSDNNARTAKGEARSKAAAISEAFPEVRVYQLYDSPYWRVKVGDFRQRSDAEAYADQIRHHFPSMSREVRVVRDRINAL